MDDTIITLRCYKHACERHSSRLVRYRVFNWPLYAKELFDNMALCTLHNNMCALPTTSCTLSTLVPYTAVGDNITVARDGPSGWWVLVVRGQADVRRSWPIIALVDLDPVRSHHGVLFHWVLGDGDATRFLVRLADRAAGVPYGHDGTAEQDGACENSVRIQKWRLIWERTLR